MAIAMMLAWHCPFSVGIHGATVEGMEDMEWHMSKRWRGVERIEPDAVVTRRLRQSLLRRYREDRRYQNMVQGDLAPLWKAAHPDGQPRPADPPLDVAAMAAYQTALHRDITERMRLRTAEGAQPTWAAFEVEIDVRKIAQTVGLPPLRVEPQLYDADPWFELYIALDFARVRGSLSILEVAEGSWESELALGEAGVGDKQWDELRSLAHEIVETCIDGMQADFEQRYADHPRRRPSTQQTEEDQLDRLFQFLYYPAQGDRLDPREREALANLAKLIGIALPRQQRATPRKSTP